jgi:lysophospholipase L1-like esterase
MNNFFGSIWGNVSKKNFMIVLVIAVGSWNLFAADSTKHWVGTWACAPYKVFESKNQPSQPLSGNTLRQIVRVSIGGDTLRVKFSNITFGKEISIKSVTIARSPDGTKCPVDASTIKQLKFKGDSTVTIAAKSEVYSDPIAFNLTPSMRLAITIYYGNCESSNDMTFHYGCRGNSYWAEGNKTTLADLGNTTIPMWYTICGVDVLAPNSVYSVAVIGNSITDGATLTGGLQNRWTDIFSEALLANPATAQVGVLNQGIGGTCVLSESNGAGTGTARFKHDILEQAGLHWVIIFYGINDITGGRSAADIFKGIKQMASEAHAKDPSIKVYGGTITPFKGNTNYSDAREAVRKEINDSILTSKSLDGYIDFSKAVQDPSDAAKMKTNFVGSWNDGLHPGPSGHEAMGKCIDLKMFIPPAVHVIKNAVPSQVSNTQLVVRNGIVEFKLSQSSFVSLKVYSVSGREIAELAGRDFSSGRHTVELQNWNLTNGTYIYSLKTDKFSTSKKLFSVY